MSDEKTLIQQAQNGDVTAFEELVSEYQKRIFSIAYRMLQNQEDAADLTQEVLVKIFKNLSRFQGDSKFSTWVYRVTTNACLDELKRAGRKYTAYSLDKEIETEDGSLSVVLKDERPTPDESLEKKTIQQVVQKAIGNLHGEHRQVIILRDLQGFSYEEIAKVLQCSVGTVKSRISRARGNLKKFLSQDRELFEEYFVKEE